MFHLVLLTYTLKPSICAHGQPLLVEFRLDYSIRKTLLKPEFRAGNLQESHQKSHQEYCASPTSKYIYRYMLSCTNYHEMRCSMQLLANNANNNNSRHLHLSFSTHVKSVHDPKSNFQGKRNTHHDASTTHCFFYLFWFFYL